MCPGTKYTPGPLCGLARGNLQWPEVLDWFSESKLSRFTFLVDLKTQYKHIEANYAVRMFT